MLKSYLLLVISLFYSNGKKYSFSTYFTRICCRKNRRCRAQNRTPTGKIRQQRHLSNELQQEVFAIAEKNVQFAIGLGIGLSSAYPYLHGEIQEQKVRLVQRGNALIIKGLGLGLGVIFNYLPTGSHGSVKEWSDKNNEFARGLGNGLSRSFKYLEAELQHHIKDLSEKNPHLADGFRP